MMHPRLELVADDVFRLAVFLVGTPAAATALVRLSAVQHTEAMLETMLAAIPPQRTFRAVWDTTPATRVLAELPLNQRAALGAAALFALSNNSIASATGDSSYADAVLGCAPAALRRMFAEDTVPPACAPWRAALQRNATAAANTPELRGHLALCAECRSAAQAWRAASIAAETQVRELLRPFTAPIPEPVRAPRPAPPWRAILLTLLVVFLITGALVWPRQSASSSATPSVTTTEPARLVQRASETLYQPLPAGDVSHLTYAIHWTFDDGSYAILQAQQWEDPLNRRTRMELKHEQGGGAYELFVIHGQKMWYRAAQIYSRTLMPYAQSTVGDRLIGLQNIDPAEMRQARLATGPWMVASSYLRAAATATVQSLGTQRSPDGRIVHLLRFDAPSPIYSNSANPQQVPIVLLIDQESERLVEIRELTGPAGGEQRVFVPWRLVQQETLPASTPEIAEIPAADTLLKGPHDPAVPLRSGKLSAPTAFGEMPVLAVLPDGISRASRIEGTYAPTRYSGARGWIEVMTYPERPRIRNNRPATSVQLPFETAAMSGTLTLQLHQRIDAMIETKGSAPQFFRVTAQGFSQQELTPVLDSLRILDSTLLAAQGGLFIWPKPTTPDIAVQLYNAIAALSADADQPTSTKISSYMRVRSDRRYSDPLSLLQERRWPAQTSTISTIVPGSFVSTRSFAEDGTPLLEEMNSNSGRWLHSPVISSTVVYRSIAADQQRESPEHGTTYVIGDPSGIPDSSLPLIPGHDALIDMLRCGFVGSEVQPDGTIMLMVRDRIWQYNGCLLGENSDFAFNEDARPYIADLQDRRGAFIQRALLSPTGELLSIERAFESSTGELLISRWEITERQPLASDVQGASKPPSAAFLNQWTFVPFEGQMTMQQVIPESDQHAALAPVWGLRSDVDGLTNVSYFSPDDFDGWPLSLLLVDKRISRSTFQLSTSQPRVVFQGPRATMMAAILEMTNPRRTSTFALSIRLGEDRVRAWEYTAYSDTVFTLIDAGETFLLIPGPLAQARGLAGLLERLPEP